MERSFHRQTLRSFLPLSVTTQRGFQRSIESTSKRAWILESSIKLVLEWSSEQRWSLVTGGNTAVETTMLYQGGTRATSVQAWHGFASRSPQDSLRLKAKHFARPLAYHQACSCRLDGMSVSSLQTHNYGSHGGAGRLFFGYACKEP